MRYIEDELGRQLSYAKRRNGLIKKALELFVVCGLDVAFIAFSPSGRLSYFAGDSRQYEPIADLIMSSEDAERHEARLAATLRNVQERMQELSGNHDNEPQPMDSVVVAGDPALDASNEVNTVDTNQESDYRAEDPDEPSEAAGVEGRGATFENSMLYPSPVSSPQSLPSASIFSGLLNAASPPIPFSPFPEAVSPNIAFQSYLEQGNGFSYNQLNAPAPDDQFYLVQSPELASATASYITHQEPPLQNSISTDGPLSDFSFPATDFVTSLPQQSVAFEVPQLQQPLSTMPVTHPSALRLALEVLSERSNTVMRPPLPSPPPVTTSEWMVQEFTMQETVHSEHDSGARLPTLPPLTPSEMATHDLSMQGTADQSRFQTDDAGFQELLNQASPSFSEATMTTLSPTVKNNQQANNMGTTRPVNLQGTAPPPTLAAPATKNIQGVEASQVPAASQSQQGECSCAQKRKFPWDFNLAPPMPQAPAYQNPISNNQALQTSGQVRGSQNQNSSLVAQVSARAQGTQNRSLNLAPQTASVRAHFSQNRHSSSAPHILFHPQGNSNGHFNPAHPAVRPPGNMSYSPLYQQMGLSPDPFMRIYMLNQGSDGCGNHPLSTL
ncbi:hypothetical protein Ancab_000340 [Ancistrocladus abbreviatus]